MVGILTNPIEPDLDAFDGKAEHGHRTLDSLDHAGSDRRQEQFSRVEGVDAAVHVRIKQQHGILAASFAAVRVGTGCAGRVFKPLLGGGDLHCCGVHALIQIKYIPPRRRIEPASIDR